jgi:hypothetical protein
VLDAALVQIVPDVARAITAVVQIVSDVARAVTMRTTIVLAFMRAVTVVERIVSGVAKAVTVVERIVSGVARAVTVVERIEPDVARAVTVVERIEPDVAKALPIGARGAQPFGITRLDRRVVGHHVNALIKVFLLFWSMTLVIACEASPPKPNPTTARRHYVRHTKRDAGSAPTPRRTVPSACVADYVLQQWARPDRPCEQTTYAGHRVVRLRGTLYFKSDKFWLRNAYGAPVRVVFRSNAEPPCTDPNDRAEVQIEGFATSDDAMLRSARFVEVSCLEGIDPSGLRWTRIREPELCGDASAWGGPVVCSDDADASAD